jgi:hypothetical protein
MSAMCRCRIRNEKRETNMIENVTTALQVNATNGDGFSVFLPESRFVTFRITGNGSVNAGAVTIECCPQNAATAAALLLLLPASQAAWTALTTIAVPANATTEYVAGSVSGTFRARISTPIIGGTVTVTAVRPEEQHGSSLLRQSQS